MMPSFSTGYREIRNFRKLLDEALERVIEGLTSPAELYSKAKDRSGLDKTSREIEDILVFEERGKPEYPEKKSKDEQTQPTSDSASNVG